MIQPDSRINYQFLYHVLPDPVVVIDRAGTIVDYNLSAKDAFTTISAGEKIENLVVDKRKFKLNLLELLQYHKVIVDKAAVRTSQSEVQAYEYKVTILSESNELFLIAFNKLSTKNELLKLEIEQTFNAELHGLLPFLNKSGKELVEKKIETKKLISIFESGRMPADYLEPAENEMFNGISALFPQFSTNELRIAYYLTMGASIQQITTITGKNTNAIRVMIHRMLARTKFKSKTEFINSITKQTQH